MYLLEIFFKRRKFMANFETVWKVLGENILPSENAVADSDPQLDLFHFTSVLYCTVYHAALSAGMSTSSAHYLARIQTQKSKIDLPIVTAAQDVFAAPDDEKLTVYGSDLTTRIESLVATLLSQNSAAIETEPKQSMAELYQYFQQCKFSAAELFSVEN